MWHFHLRTPAQASTQASPTLSLLTSWEPVYKEAKLPLGKRDSDMGGYTLPLITELMRLSDKEKVEGLSQVNELCEDVEAKVVAVFHACGVMAHRFTAGKTWNADEDESTLYSRHMVLFTWLLLHLGSPEHEEMIKSIMEEANETEMAYVTQAKGLVSIEAAKFVQRLRRCLDQTTESSGKVGLKGVIGEPELWKYIPLNVSQTLKENPTALVLDIFSEDTEEETSQQISWLEWMTPSFLRWGGSRKQNQSEAEKQQQQQKQQQQKEEADEKTASSRMRRRVDLMQADWEKLANGEESAEITVTVPRVIRDLVTTSGKLTAEVRCDLITEMLERVCRACTVVRWRVTGTQVDLEAIARAKFLEAKEFASLFSDMGSSRNEKLIKELMEELDEEEMRRLEAKQTKITRSAEDFVKSLRSALEEPSKKGRIDKVLQAVSSIIPWTVPSKCPRKESGEADCCHKRCKVTTCVTFPVDPEKDVKLMVELLQEDVTPDEVLEPFWQRGARLELNPVLDREMYRSMCRRTGTFNTVTQIDLRKRVNIVQREETRLFVQEVSLMVQLKHSNVTSLLAAEKAGRQMCYLERDVPEGTVASMVEELGPLPKNYVVSIMKQLLSGLHYLHQNGIVHCNIQGSTLRLFQSGQLLRIADFRAAALVATQSLRSSDFLTTFRSSVPFMAPEVFKEKFGTACDIWSAGCVCVHMTSGSFPWNWSRGLDPALVMDRITYNVGCPYHAQEDLEQMKEERDRWSGAALLCTKTACLRRKPSERPSAEKLLSVFEVDTDVLLSFLKDHHPESPCPSP